MPLQSMRDMHMHTHTHLSPPGPCQADQRLGASGGGFQGLPRRRLEQPSTMNPPGSCVHAFYWDEYKQQQEP